ncbi:hypothetical protein CSCA_0164 [Clostridium scatologenes]|uniref:Uncharacterized protein n=1 Tax=Clostridium scatologenes TaxID=1548 RepID=A0A0E3JY72_CLOSL|nr:hypothetical protein CSCA_0164 [Clostridium scatologenes]
MRQKHEFKSEYFLPYQEKLRDWPYEVSATTCSEHVKVLIPAELCSGR